MRAEILPTYGQAPENSRLSKERRKPKLDEGLVDNRL